jgi:hypothetical protein
MRGMVMNSTGEVIKHGRFSAALLHAALVVVIAAGFFAPALAAREQAPWVGVWQQEQPKSPNRFEAPLYKKVTTTIEAWEDGVKVSYDMVRARGGITHMEWIGRFDGKDYPMQGVAYFMTNAYRRIDDRSYEIVIKVDTHPAATATVVVSTDGSTLTVTTRETSARGEPVTSTATYRKMRSN